MILEITRDLISRLEVKGLSPQIVVAARTRNLDPAVGRDRVILPITLYDKLVSNDWAPLIASKLAYQRSLGKKTTLVIISKQLFPYLMLFPFLVLAQVLGIIPLLQPAASGIILVEVILMYPVAGVLYSPYLRKLQRTADRKTLELSVSPTLEYVLKKVETMVPEMSKDRKKIERRIKDLNEPSSG